MKIAVHWMCLFMITFFVNTNDVVAEVYKWVDENGNVHYGDRPGGPNADKVDIKESSGSTNVDPLLEQRREKQRKLLDSMEEERMEKNEQKAKLREQKQKRKKMCLKAKDYKKNMEVAGRIYTLDEKGDRVYYSDEKRKTQEKELADLIKKWCK